MQNTSVYRFLLNILLWMFKYDSKIVMLMGIIIKSEFV